MSEIVRLADTEVLKPVLRRATDEYPYWDKLKHWPLPEGIDPEIVWILREAGSWPNRRVLPLADIHGRSFSFWLPDRIQQWLHEIDRNSAAPWVLEEGRGVPSGSEREKYLVESLREESIASSQIEGASTTRNAAREMLRLGRKPRNRAEKMITNNYVAIQRIRTLKDEPLSVERLHELHVILTSDTLDEPEAAGRFRRSPQDDDVAVFDRDEKVLHRPPPGATIPDRMNRLIAFANSDSEFIHPVVKAVLLHFWLAYDHPYVDGNGRTARALFYWFMLRKGYWLFEFISISKTILRSLGQYLRAFLYSEAGNDMTYFIHYHLRAINSAIEEVRRYLAERQQLLRNSVQLLRKFTGLNHRQRHVLVEALKDPAGEITIWSHRMNHNVVYQTARTDLLELVNLGLLEMHKSGKTYVFLPTQKLLRLMSRQGTLFS